MAETNGNGNSAGNRQINANTSVTIGLVLAVFGATGFAIFKAGEVLTDLGYVKSYVSELRVDSRELRTDVAELKRLMQRLDRQQNGAASK